MGWWQKFFGRWKRGKSDRPARPGDPCTEHQPTPEEDVEIARRVLAKGEIEHALHHLAAALAADPQRRAWLELVDEWIAAAGPDPLRRFSTAPERWYAEEALRAYVLARSGKAAEALEILVAVARARPDATYLEAWALEWLESEGVLPAVAPEVIAPVVAKLAIGCPEHLETWPEMEDRAGRILAALERYDRDHPPASDRRVWRVALLRKLGRFDEAVELARRLFEEEPCWTSAVALANALRRRRNREEAIAMFQKVLQYDPDDVSARCDVADMYAESGQWQEAQRWYEEVLRFQKDHPWALPSLYLCRYVVTRQDRWLKRLKALAEDPAAGPRASSCLRWLTPYAGYLPEPTDAIANVLRQITEKLRSGEIAERSGSVQMTVNHLEPPSNLLAFRCQMEALGTDFQMELTVEQIAEPDPRVPIGPVEYLLWDYEGTTPSPALATPSEDMKRRIAALARQPYHEQANWEAAGRVAAELGPERLDEALAVMVHPPALEAGQSALAWIPRVQLAVAQVLAQIDGGWQGSLRRKVLLDVARGPRDWTTSAAILALAQLAQRLPEAAADVVRVYRDLYDCRPREGACSYLDALLSSWLLLPGLPESQRTELRRLLDELRSA